MTTGQITTLPVPSGHGSLDQYIHTVNSIPLLTPEEEHNLAERKMGGDVEAAKQLILSHLRVVVSIARGYDGYGYGDPYYRDTYYKKHKHKHHHRKHYRDWDDDYYDYDDD